jgi:hypothetical protein
MDALKVWALAELRQTIDPYEVLSREEIAQLWEDAEY